MSIWSKLVAGATDWALGGPLGALLGGRDGGDGERGDATRRVAFTIGAIALSAKMAKADGRVTGDEVAAFRQMFHVEPGEERNVRRIFDLARRDAGGFEPYARQIARLFSDRTAVLEDLLGCLFHIAKADQVIHPDEIEFLRQVAGIFGFGEADFARIRSYHLGPDQADPYQILGLAHDVDDADLKAAWRRLARENHPDSLLAQGLPPEFIAVAEEKIKAINDAYERICRERGLR